jgi:hypothetical protein
MGGRGGKDDDETRERNYVLEINNQRYTAESGLT